MPFIMSIMGVGLGLGLGRRRKKARLECGDVYLNITHIGSIIINNIQPMAETQQFQLKLAVCHHPTLKTQQLIEFLENESNEFLTNDFPHSITQDHFITVFETLPQSSLNSNDFSQYVGLLLLYSSSSVESYQIAIKSIPSAEALADLFLIVVEMDNTDKKTNAIGDEGERLCKKNGYQFVKLTLYNSEDLVACLHKNLYELIENYYYPNEEERPAKKNMDSQYLLHYNTEPVGESQDPHQKSVTSNLVNSPLTMKKDKERIVATKQERKSFQKLLQKASQLRESRNNEIIMEQKQIDESIENVEKVLRKINQNIESKLAANWYTSLNHTLYSPLQKNSVSYAKIKLTQEFLEQSDGSDGQTPGQLSRNRKRNSKVSNKGPAQPEKAALVNKFIAKHRKLEPILKLLLTVSESVIVELDVHQESDYHDLTLLAIRKLGISETQKNYNLMKKIITDRIEQFIKQLSRAVKATQKIRIDQRSFLKPNQISQNRNLFRSNASSNSNAQSNNSRLQ